MPFPLWRCRVTVGRVRFNPETLNPKPVDFGLLGKTLVRFQAPVREQRGGRGRLARLGSAALRA